MATHVYANSNEIASKSADGSSKHAFPDVCHTPPATASPTPIKPFPPGVPIPYPNSCHASDITNGSRTVFILGKEIALENHSYFSVSEGDDAATRKLAKGIISGAVKGRCYFQTWSPNVKVEGRGVARHLDWVTHNHRNPPNAVQRQYISQRMQGTECDSDRRAIERACPEKTQQQANSRNAPRPRRSSFSKLLGNMASIPDNAAKTALGYRRRQGASNSWVDDYCDGLWIKPQSGQQAFEDAKKAFEDVFDVLSMSKTDIAKAVLGELVDMAYERLGRWFLVRKLGGLAARSVLKNIVGAAAGATGVGLVVTGAMAAWTITDVISTATDIAEALGPEGMEHLQDLLDIDRLKELADRKIAEYRASPDKFMADLMTLQAARDPCVRARKCMLVPYNRTGAADAANTGEGCCPGQTGHHVIPGAMFKNGEPDAHPCYKGAQGSKHNSAPTICLEGASNNHGSHGIAHSSLSAGMAAAGFNRGDPINYTQARELGIAAIRTVAPHCSAACLRAQLDAFYQGCDQSPLSAHAGDSGRGTPAAGANTGNDSGR